MSIWPVTSFQVAYSFGKEHDRVLKDIRNLPISKDFHAVNFDAMFVGIEVGNKAIRMSPAYHLTRGGFMLLAVGYTGAKAMALKEAYIAEFNRMEAELHNRVPALPDFSQSSTVGISVRQRGLSLSHFSVKTAPAFPRPPEGTPKQYGGSSRLPFALACAFTACLSFVLLWLPFIVVPVTNWLNARLPVSYHSIRHIGHLSFT